MEKIENARVPYFWSMKSKLLGLDLAHKDCATIDKLYRTVSYYERRYRQMYYPSGVTIFLTSDATNGKWICASNPLFILSRLADKSRFDKQDFEDHRITNYCAELYAGFSNNWTQISSLVVNAGTVVDISSYLSSVPIADCTVQSRTIPDTNFGDVKG